MPESSNFSIVQAGPKDADLLIQLIHELAQVHNNHDGPEINAKILAHDLENHACFAFIAYSGEEPAGMALYYLSYSTWQGQVAYEKWYKRLSLNVLDWNENATKLYDSLGAINLTKNEGWLVYRFDEERIRNLAQDP
uniref:N-acetyltransferase domain-containing protein n=1 Tax=Acrobeloides nanus TaxID=290746 RepID=A0A914DSL4_9BILA